MGYRICVDAGGTFTDGVLTDEAGNLHMRKAHTTPSDPTIGTLNCIAYLAEEVGLGLEDLLAKTETIVHGTTLATNAVATKSGAKLGTIATKGFRLRMAFPQVAKGEWLEGPEDMYDFRSDPPESLTPYYLMTEVEERMGPGGEVLTPLNEADLRDKLDYLKGEGVTAVALMFMHSPVNPAHERRAAEIVRDEYPEMFLAVSSSVRPVVGEVERWSTTMFSAYVAPIVTSYVGKIERLLKEKGFAGQLLFIQSNGGIATPEIVSENPATLLLSGPAAGPALGRALGQQHDKGNVLSVDMGGTSFDVGVIHDGIVETVDQQVIDGKKFALPSVDVTAVGAGGGSIAYIDAGGRLRVGPKSAGASPGPACYGNGGTEPTVTDANVVLGYLDPDFFLGGQTKLRKDLAETAIRERIAKPLGLGVEEAAAAIYQIINSNMASGTDVNFAKRGYDPRDFVLCAAGGAAAVHAVEIARELRMSELVVPKVAPIYCAYGMMFCDLKHDYQRSYHAETAKADLKAINALFDEMEAMARDTLRREGVADKDMRISRAMDLRYYGQFRDRTAPVAAEGPIAKAALAETVGAFHKVHEQTIGYSDANYPTEIMRLHLSGSAVLPKPVSKTVAKGGDAAKARKGARKAFFPGSGFIDTPVYDGANLLAGAKISGPAIIEERFTTFVLPPGSSAEVDAYGSFIARAKEA